MHYGWCFLHCIMGYVDKNVLCILMSEINNGCVMIVVEYLSKSSHIIIILLILLKLLLFAALFIYPLK